jgi:signal transduction histidine kinase
MNLLRFTPSFGLLMNSNSVKFTKAGYIFVTVSFEDNSLVFSVKDTGIGISKKLCDAIFEPFVQADTSLTRKHQGYPLPKPY